MANPSAARVRISGRIPAPVLVTFMAVSLFAEAPVYELEPYEVENGPVIEQLELTSHGDALTRVGQEQIHALGAGDLSAALRRVPGISISRYNVVGAFGGGDGGAIYIRGQGSGRPGAQIVTLTDGIPRYVGVWSHPLLDTLPTDFSSSIEVYKSPQPVRFGNMAFGAVNLVPARAYAAGWSGSVRAELGAWETRSLTGELGYAGEGLNLYAGMSHRESDGHRPNSDGEVSAFQGRAAWTSAGGWEISFLTQAIRSAANDPEREGTTLPVVERYEVENQFHLGQIERETGNWNLSAKVYAEVGDLDWRQWHAPPPPPFPGQVLSTRTLYGNHGVRTALAYDGGSFRIAGGVDFDSFGGRVTEAFALGQENRFNEERFHLTGPFLRGEWTLLPSLEGGRLLLSLGTRAFFHDTFANKAAWQSGLVYENDDLTLYLNHARSHTYPGVFVSVFGRRPPPWNVGADWQTLSPEQVDHFETGLSTRLGRGLVLNIALFHDAVENALRIAPPPPSGRIFNLGNYTVRGSELSLQGRLSEHLELFSGLTWLDADASVPNAPEWTLTVGADWLLAEGLTLGGDLQLVDEQRIIDTRFDNPRGSIAAYSLFNLRLSREFTAGSARVELYLRADNLLDESYEHRPGYPMPGRSLSGGFRTRF